MPSLATVHPQHPPVTLPLSLEQITPEWLTSALGTAVPGVVVEAVAIDQVQWGTATKVQLRLGYNAAGVSAGLPRSMYLKAGLAGPEQIALVGRALECEARFYGDWRPALDINAPRAYYAATAVETGQAVVLLEDLGARGVRFGSPLQALSVETAQRTLDLLARCHARWWRSPSLQGLDAYPGMLDGIAEHFFAMQHWHEHLARARGRFVPAALRDRRRLRSAWLAMQAHAQNAQAPACFLHGDAHIGNMYFEPDGAPGFLDWQNIMRGPWAHDVAYFLAGALPAEDRRRHERELLLGYLDRLAAHGGEPPGFDEAWLQYRRHVIHGFCWVLTPTQMQSEENCEAMAERVCAAITDLDTLGALGM
jgi:hypothetical protein